MFQRRVGSADDDNEEIAEAEEGEETCNDDRVHAGPQHLRIFSLRDALDETAFADLMERLMLGEPFGVALTEDRNRSAAMAPSTVSTAPRRVVGVRPTLGTSAGAVVIMSAHSPATNTERKAICLPQTDNQQHKSVGRVPDRLPAESSKKRTRPEDEANEQQIKRAKIAAKQAKACKKVIQATTKPCPECRAKIEKRGGCDHMSCRCGHQFCWVCSAPWRAIIRHGNHRHDESCRHYRQRH